MKQKHNIPDSMFVELYQRFGTLGKIAAELKVPQVTVFRRCQKLGLKFKNGGKQERIPLSEILEGKHPQTTSTALKRKLLKEGLKENRCEECGITDYNGKPLVMQLDHVDGDNSNHILSNLKMLCPNCHSQTPTYCGRNI